MSRQLKVYGLRQCDTCRKAMKWLEDRGVEFEFIDIRKTPLTGDIVDSWLKQVPLDKLINRRGTTWRGLSESQRENLTGATARNLILAHPSVVKRPVFALKSSIFVGFGTAEQARLLDIASR